MKPSQIALFAAIAIVVFLFFALSRETIVGADTPAFLMYSCGKVPVGHGGSPVGMPLSAMIFKIMPCNMLFFKGLAVFLLFVSTLIIAKCGELFDEKKGWLAGWLAFGNGLWLFNFLRLEEQNLAVPIIFLAFYFMLKREFLKSILVMCIAGLLWKGAIYFLFLPLAFSIIGIPIVVAIAGIFWKELAGPLFDGLNNLPGAIAGKEIIAENAVAAGLVWQFGLFFGLFSRNKTLTICSIYTLAIAFLAVKYSMFAVPFLSVGVILAAQEKKYENFDLLCAILAIGVTGWILFSMPSLFPSNAETSLIKETVLLSNGKQILNDWGYGWWIKFYDGKTENFGGQDFPDFNSWNGFALSQKDSTCAIAHSVPQTRLKVLSCP